MATRDSPLQGLDPDWLARYVTKTDIFVHPTRLTFIKQSRGVSHPEALLIYFREEADNDDRARIANAWRQKRARVRRTQELSALRNATTNQEHQELRNATSELSETDLTEFDAMLGGLSERERVAVQRAFKAKVASEVEKETEQAEKRAMDNALLWLEGLEPDELLEHLPGGPKTVSALLDWLSPADLESLRNALVGTAANIQEFNRIMETPQ